MNKFKYIILALTIFVFNIHSISADCTEEALKEFKGVKDEYTVKYEFNKSTQNYTIYFNAPLPEKFYYQIYTDMQLDCSAEDNKTLKCINFPSGNYEVVVSGITEECNDSLKTIKLKLPKYNEYSEDPLCEGIEDFVLCSPTYSKDIDYESFVSRVNTYKKGLEKQEEPEPEEPDQTIIDTTIEYVKNNLVSIIIVIAFIILLIITIIITAKSIRKSRRLE